MSKGNMSPELREKVNEIEAARRATPEQTPEPAIAEIVELLTLGAEHTREAASTFESVDRLKVAERMEALIERLRVTTTSPAPAPEPSALAAQLRRLIWDWYIVSGRRNTTCPFGVPPHGQVCGLPVEAMAGTSWRVRCSGGHETELRAPHGIPSEINTAIDAMVRAAASLPGGDTEPVKPLYFLTIGSDRTWCTKCKQWVWNESLDGHDDDQGCQVNEGDTSKWVPVTVQDAQEAIQALADYYNELDDKLSAAPVVPPSTGETE